MARYQNIEEQLENLNVDEEEIEDLIFDGDIEEEIGKYDLCLVPGGEVLDRKKHQYKSHEIENG